MDFGFFFTKSMSSSDMSIYHLAIYLYMYKGMCICRNGIYDVLNLNIEEHGHSPESSYEHTDREKQIGIR